MLVFVIVVIVGVVVNVVIVVIVGIVVNVVIEGHVTARSEFTSWMAHSI